MINCPYEILFGFPTRDTGGNPSHPQIWEEFPTPSNLLILSVALCDSCAFYCGSPLAHVLWS